MVFFAQKTPDFGPKNRLRIWGVPPSPPLRIFFQRKGGYGLRGYPAPPFTDKIREVVFDGAPRAVFRIPLYVFIKFSFVTVSVIMLSLRL